MFNLYTYEKRKKTLANENMKNLVNSKEYIKKRDKLARKFYSKINNFLFEMAKNPIVIKNNYYISNEKNNNSYQRPKFETDRERIERLIKSQREYQYKTKPINLVKKEKLKNKILINDIFNKNNESSNIINYNNINNTTELIYHPSDTSNKSPNELEKILDTIYINQDLENKKEINDKSSEQYLMKLNKEKIKIKENKNIKSHISKMKMKMDLSNRNMKKIYDLKNKINLEKKLFYLRKEKNCKNSKIKLNKTARNFSKDENDSDTSFKTYFNSIQQAIVCKSKKYNNDIISKFNQKKFKRLKSSASAINFSSPKNKNLLFYGDIKNKDKVDDSMYEDDNKETNLSKNEMEKQIITYHNYKKEIIDKIKQLNNPPLYDKPYQQIRKKDLKILKQLAIEDEEKHKKKFSKNNVEENEQTELKGFFSNYEISDISGVHSKITNIKNKINKGEIIEDENLILYNNCVYYKNDQNDMNKLGKIILQKCHFVNNKFYNNENNKLQKGNGKLMITNGLSINEFIDKFSLPNLNNKNIII